MELLFTLLKILTVTALVTVPLIILLVRRFRHGSIMIPNSGVLITATLVPLAYILSVIFAADKHTALLGFTFNTDSFGVILLGFLAMMVTVLWGVRKGIAESVRKGIVYFSTVMVLLFVVQIIVQGLSIPGSSILSLLQPASSWLDIAALTGLLVVFLMNPLQGNATVDGQVPAVGRMRVGVLVVSMLFLGIVTNVTSVFCLLAGISLFKVVQIVRTNKSAQGVVTKGAVVLPSIVLVFSLFFIADNTLINAKITSTIQGWTQISFVDVRPNWQGTLDVAKGTVVSSDVATKIFGPGAGSFSEQWRVHKPLGVNNTQFWSTDFNNGVGFIPTSSITGGAMALAAWVLFLLVLAWCILRSRSSVFGLSTLFIWVFAICNPMGMVLLVIAYVLTGLFILEMARMRLVRVVNYKMRGEGAYKVVAFLVVPALLVASLGAFLLVAHRSVVNTYLLKASSAMLEGDMNTAELLLNRAKLFADVALVEQGYTKVGLARLSGLLQESSAGENDIDQAILQAALSNVLFHAQRSIEREPQNPVGYVALGNISEQLITLGIEGSEQSALTAYQQAAILDPRNPSIYFAMARVYGSVGEVEKALGALEQSLELKSNYIPALYRHGVLKLAGGDAVTAIQSLGSVIQIDQHNANALYYLALALQQEGRVEEALVFMQRVSSLNPDNEDVKVIIARFNELLNPVIVEEIPALDVASTSDAKEE